MKVRDLIALLSKEDPDADVIIENHSEHNPAMLHIHGVSEAYDVKTPSVQLDADNEEWNFVLGELDTPKEDV